MNMESKLTHRSKKEHPATLYNKARHHVFSLFEKTNDVDKSLEVIDAHKLLRPLKAGLKAELIFYDRFRDALQLEPLLDAGVKADFTGLRKGTMINLDVTTNLEYKDINKYVNCIQKRKKLYEIVLVDLKKEDIEFFPLRFPICPRCQRFSHYVVYISRPSSDVFFFASTGQTLFRYCSYCDEADTLEYFDYRLDSILYHLEERLHDQREPETSDPDFNANRYIKQESISIIRFFEGRTNLLVSALAEGDYIITDPRDADGYYGGKVLWTHPLARKYFNDVMDYDYYDGPIIL